MKITKRIIGLAILWAVTAFILGWLILLFIKVF